MNAATLIALVLAARGTFHLGRAAAALRAIAAEHNRIRQDLQTIRVAGIVTRLPGELGPRTIRGRQEA